MSERDLFDRILDIVIQAGATAVGEGVEPGESYDGEMQDIAAFTEALLPGLADELDRCAGELTPGVDAITALRGLADAYRAAAADQAGAR